MSTCCTGSRTGSPRRSDGAQPTVEGCGEGPVASDGRSARHCAGRCQTGPSMHDDRRYWTTGRPNGPPCMPNGLVHLHDVLPFIDSTEAMLGGPSGPRLPPGKQGLVAQADGGCARLKDHVSDRRSAGGASDSMSSRLDPPSPGRPRESGDTASSEFEQWGNCIECSDSQRTRWISPCSSSCCWAAPA